MAPPTVVLHRDFVNIPKDCPIIKIVQNECDFSRATKHFKCIPSIREFKACETPEGVRHYEITKAPSPEVKRVTKEMLSMSE